MNCLSRRLHVVVVAYSTFMLRLGVNLPTPEPTMYLHQFYILLFDIKIGSVVLFSDSISKAS